MNIFIILIACLSMTLISLETSNGMHSLDVSSYLSLDDDQDRDDNQDTSEDTPEDTRPSNVQLMRSVRAFDALASPELLEDLALLMDNDEETDQKTILAKIKQLLARVLCRSNSRDT